MALLDCLDMPCPQPVVKCRDFLRDSQDNSLHVLVDNDAAVQNVCSFLSSRGWAVSVKAEGHCQWRIMAEKEEGQASPAEQAGMSVSADTQAESCPCQPESNIGKTLVFIPTETMGRGDEELGSKLMVNFLATLPELGSDLWRIVLVNGGVKLATPGPALEKIQALEASGVSVLVCGTCLDHYGLLAQKQAGDTTNMLDIVTSLQLADKVIRP